MLRVLSDVDRVLGSVAMNGEHDLLLRHFETWARKSGRTPDLDFMEVLLDLRSSYDDLAPTFWPPHSIEHLLTERWPAKGPIETPEPSVVADTLEAFVRFLRNTGRLASGSGDPSALAKEARRSSKRMAEVASDRASWSFTKQLQDFGLSQGISFEDAPDLDTLQARLDHVTALWNALPIDQRRALSPSGGGPAVNQELSGKQAAMASYGVDDPVVALLLTFADRLPTGRLPDEDVVAPYVAQSSYGQRLLRLAEWVGDGKEITGTSVLRPALAREAYDVLGLGDWQLAQLRREYPDERLGGVAKVGLDAWIAERMEQRWRSAADCEELHRLWLGAVGSGLVLLEGKRARWGGEHDLSAARWVEIGVRAVVTMAEAQRARPFGFFALVFALMESYVGHGTPVPKESMLEFLIDWQWSPADQAEWDEWSPGWRERHYGPYVEEAAGIWSDTGLYTEDEQSISLTPFGDVFVTAWLAFLEQ